MLTSKNTAFEHNLSSICHVVHSTCWGKKKDNFVHSISAIIRSIFNYYHFSKAHIPSHIKCQGSTKAETAEIADKKLTLEVEFWWILWIKRKPSNNDMSAQFISVLISTPITNANRLVAQRELEEENADPAVVLGTIINQQSLCSICLKSEKKKKLSRLWNVKYRTRLSDSYLEAVLWVSNCDLHQGKCGSAVWSEALPGVWQKIEWSTNAFRDCIY